MYQRTHTSKFLTGLLHSPVYRRAHGIDRITSDIQRYLSSEDTGKNISVVLLHYVEGPTGKTYLGVSALINSDPNAPGSCIQGDLTRGANLSVAMCAKLKLVLFATVPVQYTTNLSGLHVHSKGVGNL